MPAKKGRSGKAAPAKKAAAKKAVAKKAAKKAPVKKAAAKKPAAKKAKRKANPALLKPLTPSATLADVIGPKPEPRGQIIKKIWAYIKKHGLQDQKNKRNINADDKLKKLFGGKSVVDMFQLAKIVSGNLS
jgi:chromatin remodeling complex protein RSC6